MYIDVEASIESVINKKWWWGSSNAGALGNLESTQTRSGTTC